MTGCERVVWILVVLLGAVSPKVLAGRLRSVPEKKQAVVMEELEKRRRLLEVRNDNEDGEEAFRVPREWLEARYRPTTATSASITTMRLDEELRAETLAAQVVWLEDLSRNLRGLESELREELEDLDATLTTVQRWLSVLGLVWLVLCVVEYRAKHSPVPPKPTTPLRFLGRHGRGGGACGR